MQQKEPENTKQTHLSCHGGGSSAADNDRAASPYFSFLGFVLAVFGEEVGEDVSTATSHVHQGALLPQAEARGNSQHQSDGLDHQGPFAQITPNNKPTQNSLDLRFKEIRVYTNYYNHLINLFFSCDGFITSQLADNIKNQNYASAI